MKRRPGFLRTASVLAGLAVRLAVSRMPAWLFAKSLTSPIFCSFFALAIFFGGRPCLGQDTRVVKEPEFPFTLNGYDAKHRLGISFDNVTLASPEDVKISSAHAKIKLGPGPVNFWPSGNDVTVTGSLGAGNPYSCGDKFPPIARRPRSAQRAS